MTGWPRMLLVAAIVTAFVAGCENTYSTRPVSLHNDRRIAPREPVKPGPELYVRVGTLHLRSGRLEQAAKAFRRAVALDPDCARAHALLGAVLDHLDQHGEAVKHHRLAVDLTPKDALAWNNMGYCYLRQKCWASAVTAFEMATELAPENKRFRNNLAVALAMDGQYDESLAAFTQVVGAAQAHYNMGCMHLCQKHRDEARREFRRALGLEPELREAAQWVARLSVASAATQPSAARLGAAAPAGSADRQTGSAEANPLIHMMD